jgi:hypothetical protein
MSGRRTVSAGGESYQEDGEAATRILVRSRHGGIRGAKQRRSRDPATHHALERLVLKKMEASIVVLPNRGNS